MLAVLLVGQPISWALGLSSFIVIIMAVPMAWVLLRRRPLKLPRGFSWWALFLIWSLFGVLLLGIDPQGYLTGTWSSRLLGYSLRELSYISVTIVLLFVGNLTEEELPLRTIIRWLGWFFVAVTAGGVAGVLFPNAHFASPLEFVLPHSIASNDYVQTLIHPKTAQVMNLITDATPRPAAPFSYTNAWGFHIVILGVWFILDRFVLTSKRSQVVSTGILVVGVIVLVMSLNRAAWIGVIVAFAIVALRLALRGRIVVVLGMVLAAMVAMGVLVATPMGDLIEKRLDNGNSDTIRAFTIEKAFELSAESPVVGFGTTRSTLGSATSIAVGRSPKCPTCGNASIGMNGYLYMLLVTTGYVGAALFFGFGAYVATRAWRRWSPVSIVGTTVLLTTAFFSLFYDVATFMLVPFVTIGVLWREDQNWAARREDSPDESGRFDDEPALPGSVGRSPTQNEVTARA